MLLLTDLKISPRDDPQGLKALCAHRLGVPDGAIISLRAVRRSIDARKKNDILLLYTLEVGLSPADEARILKRTISGVSALPPRIGREPVLGDTPLDAPIVIVGMGPAGLFAAYTLARYGYKPLLIERGRDVDSRARDVEGFWSGAALNPQSNVMFGEGGAGTFSDGKLTTRIKDERAADVVELLHRFGADESVTQDAKPHIGTDALRAVVKNMRLEIIALGGEVRFETQLTGLNCSNGAVTAVKLCSPAREEILPCAACILAIGQGARDTYSMLHQSGVELAPKAFAVGARIEHPQQMIDSAQFGALAGHPRLGAAEYRLTAKSGARGVYTFCMCPGGEVIASSSGAMQVVTNGMSSFARDKVNANAAVVVQVGCEDFGNDPLSGMYFQQELERRAYELGGGDFCAPAQRYGDFAKRVASTGFGGVRPSYRPGVKAAALDKCLPDFIAKGLRDGVASFGRQLKGFDMPDAVLTAVESRTSSPVRILRTQTGEATRLNNLYPVGEGAGYAGGIVSAAVDGMKAAQRIMERFKPLI